MGKSRVCGLCGKSAETLRHFPSNNVPDVQSEWMIRLNLLEEEKDRYLLEFKQGKRSCFWCHRHFHPTDPRGFPIDMRDQGAPHRMPDLLPYSELDTSDRHLSQDSVPPVLSRVSQESINGSDICDNNIDLIYKDELLESQESMATQKMEDIDINYVPTSQSTVHDEEDSCLLVGAPSLECSDYLVISRDKLSILLSRCCFCGHSAFEDGSMKTTVQGSAITVSWTCLHCGTDRSWSSQKTMNGRYNEGDLKITAAAYTNAVPYPRLREMAETMSLALPSERTYRNHLCHIVLPSVDNIYKKHMDHVLSLARNTMGKRGLDLAGDGRYCTPGFSARNCTYDLIDLKLKLIVAIANVHKNEEVIDGKSNQMEKEGLRRALINLVEQGFKIRTLVTDNDAKIGKMLREEDQFKMILHLLDFWHIIKKVVKELRELAKRKDCPNISYWRRRIINHAYYVHKKYPKSRKKALEYWKSVLAHVCGRHRHLNKVSFINGIDRCRHKHLPVSQGHKIDRRSNEYRLLKELIMKPTFLKAFLRANPKMDSSPCEKFHSIINLYAPKRLAHSPELYTEKIKLATMHANTISLADMLGTRRELSSTAVSVPGRDALSVKRKMSRVDHTWRRDVFDAIRDVIANIDCERKNRKYLDSIGAPDDLKLMEALRDEMEEEEDGGDADDSSSECSIGGYGDERGSEGEEGLYEIVLSDMEDEESEEDEDDLPLIVLKEQESEWSEEEKVDSTKECRARTGRRDRSIGVRGVRGGRGPTIRRQAPRQGQQSESRESESEESDGSPPYKLAKSGKEGKRDKD